MTDEQGTVRRGTAELVAAGELVLIATLGPSLPAGFAPDLMDAVGAAAEAYGYTDLTLRQDDWAVLGRPPGRAVR